MNSPADARSPKHSPCPICAKRAVEPFRPFCSRRCADVDLNRWLSGVYAVPAVEAEAEDAEAADGEPPNGRG
jgi:endogenous inhibitor of DNA gyrase (YacG/DUF329 family)